MYLALAFRERGFRVVGCVGYKLLSTETAVFHRGRVYARLLYECIHGSTSCFSSATKHGLAKRRIFESGVF
jgi:hypothetical protein